MATPTPIQTLVSQETIRLVFVCVTVLFSNWLGTRRARVEYVEREQPKDPS